MVSEIVGLEIGQTIEIALYTSVSPELDKQYFLKRLWSLNMLLDPSSSSTMTIKSAFFVIVPILS